MPAHFCQLSTPSLPLSTFCLATSLPLSVRTLSWKTNKELQKLWENNNSLKNIHTVLISCCRFIFQSLTQEDSHKLPLNALFSLTETTLKRRSTRARPLPTPCPLLSTLLLTPSLPQNLDILYGCPQEVN